MANWPHGLGESLGDSLVVNEPLETAGDVWYVHHTGSDAYDGRDRAKPLATLGEGVVKAQPGDIILCLDGHTETVETAITMGQECVTVVGAGSSGGFPTVKITPGSGMVNDNLIDITQQCISIRNIWFRESAIATSGSKIGIGTSPDGCLIKDCYFECGAHDTGAAVILLDEVDHLRIQGTTFVSTATVVTAQPLTGILMLESKSAVNFVMEDVIFDGGTAGFSDFFAFDSSGGSGMVGFRFERISLLNGADMVFNADDFGILNVGTAHGGARIDWFPSA